MARRDGTRGHPAEQGKTRPRQDPRMDFWTRTRRVSGGSRAPASFVDFATAPRLLATAFVVLEAAAAATCPQIAASAVLEVAATAPCTRSAVLVRGLGRSDWQLAPAAGSLHHRGEGSQGGGRLPPQLDAADQHQAKEEEDAKGEMIKGRGRRRGSRWAPVPSPPWSPGSPAAT